MFVREHIKIRCNGALLFIIFFVFSFILKGQENFNIDSLKFEIRNTTEVFKKMVVLDSVLNLKTLNPSDKLELANMIIELAKKQENYSFLSQGYLQKANALQQMGDYLKALESYLVCMDYTKLADEETLDEAALTISIADTYSLMENSKNAQHYYQQGIALLRDTKNKNDSTKLASALLNAGDEFYYDGRYDKALEYFKESETLFKSLDFKIGIAYNLGNQGMVYAALGQHEMAKANINKAIAMLEELEHYDPVSVYLNEMSSIYETQSNYDLALEYSSRSLQLAKKLKAKDQISEANLQLSKLYEKSGQFDRALNAYKNYKIYRDSIINIETVQQVADLRTDMEVGKKQSEVDLLTQKRKTNRIVMFAIAGASFFIIVIALGLYRRNNYIKKTNKIISNEKERSDKLLLNILPEKTAQELKDHGRVKAKRFDSVTVLFSDFKGFTHYAENLEPEELVNTVDYYFSKFDEIVEKYGLEKIKTVGDAYMVAGGLPFVTEDHAIKMTKAAFEMVAFVNSSKESNLTSASFDIRIGINTGPVVAGVVGSKKFAYDIWGDTVNIAARMETNSEPGKINISENTYHIIKSEFSCSYRGELEVKNRGKLKMFFVSEPLQKHSDPKINFIQNDKIF
ncbi:tetratricopeptide repeat protein [Paucihalobacter ruber]|uniref:Adenylate cyclase n=2 Tax=Paucihalobacter ruber TaxID=2567861 RepID=A0A506PHD4_9FLAO|nr:tetratricopeptide repeat protein [Paucihalobacter ruber]